MSSLGGSIEEQIAKKLHFNELTPAEQVQAGLQYFRIIIEGSVRTSPPELKGVLNLLYGLLEHDAQASITKWLINYESNIAFFFKQNMQRFDRFEFQPYFDKLKGKTAAKAYTVPVYDRRNFEQFQPMNLQQYAILEKDGVDNRGRVQGKDFYAVAESRQQSQQALLRKLQQLQQELQGLMSKQGIAKDVLAKDVRSAQECCVSALQMKYNTQAVAALEKALLEGVTENVFEVLDSLRMPQQQQTRFCEVLEQKCSQRRTVKTV